MPLKTEWLPGGPVWVVGRYFHIPFQQPLLHALTRLPHEAKGIRLCVDRIDFWRLAATELWEAKRFDTLKLRLSGALSFYNPWTYLLWGRLLARENLTADAGKYLLLSGLYQPHEEGCVEAFKKRCQHMSPQQVISQFPRPCHQRWARSLFPERVLRDCSELPCPPWWLRRVVL
ncbi:hypothetical protein F0U61_23055 [Archangium violaceum]|uniref:hypothetical protein n=1 Tax=Archangium violaceum TaxID=83451 RepID=UPI002B2865FB|nr:hypothetical protein F0U61_23055 [Archangium violaceum]